MSSDDKVRVRQKADELIELLRSAPTRQRLDEARRLLEELRENRAFGHLGALAEATSRYRPNDLMVRRLLAQSLIEQGNCSVAKDVATVALAQAAATEDPEEDELSGILGRACKQIFMDDPTATSSDTLSEGARIALETAISAYQGPWRKSQDDNTWHGINLAAMVHVADALGIAVPDPIAESEIAAAVLRALAKAPVIERDHWWHATKIEAHVARREWPEAGSEMHAYLSDRTVPTFNFASTLRQLRDVWRVEDLGPEGLALMQTLEAKYLERESPGPDSCEAKPALLVSPTHLRSVLSAPIPDDAHLERVLGTASTQTLRWYRTGLTRAASVAAIRKKQGTRIGTGFAVNSADLALEAGEILVLTNFHVVNIAGAGIAARPQEIEVIFEADDPGLTAPYRVKQVVAESPDRGGLDFALLRLDRPAEGIDGVPFGEQLPSQGNKSRIYIIGHPRGQELQFSLQDNWVLDHEGPPHGSPPRPERLRVHYFAPTAEGSSGSPVFDDAWDCVALHHAGAKHEPPPEDSGMRKLNGQAGYYSANEGIFIQSIREYVKERIS